MDILGERQDGQRRGDPLITTTGITHHRNHSAVHPGVASGGSHRQHVRIGRVAQVFATEIARNRLADRMAIVPLHGGLGGRLVQPGRLHDETDLIQRHVHGEIIHHRERETQILLLFPVGLTSGVRQRVHKDRPILLQIDETGMLMADHRRRPRIAGPADHLDIELVNLLLQVDRDGPVLHQCLTPLQSFRCQILQHLQPISRLTDQGTQRDRDR